MGWAAAPCSRSTSAAPRSGLLELALIVEALGPGRHSEPVLLDRGRSRVCCCSTPARERSSDRLAAAHRRRRGDPDDGDHRARRRSCARTRSAPASRRPATASRSTAPSCSCATPAWPKAIICLARSRRRAENDLTLVMVPRGRAGLSLRRLQAAGGEALWEVGLRRRHGRCRCDRRRTRRRVAACRAAAAARRRAQVRRARRHRPGLARSHARATPKRASSSSRPIGSFQAVQHHCAEMYRDLEVSRLLAWQAAASLGEGVAGAREVAMAKAKCSEAIPAVTRTAQQIHGAIALLPRLSARALLPPRDRRAGGLRRRRPSPARAREACCAPISIVSGETIRHDLPVHYV